MGIPFLEPDIPESGYKGSVPKYTATRRAVDNSAQTGRRPGQGGRRYFSDTVYSNMDGADQGNQTTTMIPRGTTASALRTTGRQADALKAEQDARFAAPTPAYGAPDKNNNASPSPYNDRGVFVGYGPGEDTESSPSPYNDQGVFVGSGAGSGYRGDAMPRSPFRNGQPNSGYRGGRFDDISITEDPAMVDLTEQRVQGYKEGGLAQFGAGSGYRGVPMPRSPFRRASRPSPYNDKGVFVGSGASRPSPYNDKGVFVGYGAGSGYRGQPGRTGQEGISGIRTGAKRPPGQPPEFIVPPASGFAPNKGIVADNYGEMMRRREQMEKYKREMNDGERNTPEYTMPPISRQRPPGQPPEYTIPPISRQRPPGPMQNKGRRRRSDGTESRVGGGRNFKGITDLLKNIRNRKNDLPYQAFSGVPMQAEQRMRGFRGFAEGGVAQTSPGQGYYLGGKTDGMADEIVSTIDGEVEARLSDGEYVIPADVVSHLGNGNSAAGADKLGKMMDNVRKERTGNKEQGKKIDADKVINKMSGGIAQFNTGGEVVTGANSSISPYAGDYVADMLGKGAAAADTSYQAYTGPLTAGASDLQQQAFRGVGSLQTPGAMGGQGYQTQTFGAQQANQYMNPYLQASLDPQLRENRREAEIQRIQDAGRLTKAGAFGGSRQAIMEAEGARNLLQNQADITARGYDTAFQQAQKQFNTEQDRGMTAQDKANKFGFDVLTAQRNAGDTQRDIEAEGIAADKAQFEEERDYAQKQIQYQKSLLEGLPLESQSKQFMGPSDLAQLFAILGAGGQLSEVYDKYTGGSGGGDSFNPDPFDEYDGAFDDGDGGYEDAFDTDNYVDNTIQSGDTFKGASNAGANAANRDNQFGGR